MLINTRGNITNIGESIFFLVSKLASGIAADYVIRTVNEALSYWLTQRLTLHVQGKEQFTAGHAASTEEHVVYTQSELIWLIIKYTQTHQRLKHIDGEAYNFIMSFR